MAFHNDLGKRGEDIAKEYLEGKGYHIVKLNWKHSRAEIDLIAIHDGVLVFVEVKTRSSLDYGNPEDFVDWKKEQHLEYAALAFIEMQGHVGEIRFDVVAIDFETKNKYNINHIEDAFWPS